MGKLIKIIVALCVLSALGYGGYRWHFSKTKKQAQAALDKGYAMLAAEKLEGHRNCMVSSADNCRQILNTYFTARWVQRLEWASEACLDSGVDIAEAYIGLAAAKEFSGRPQEALQVLGGVIEKFKEVPDIFYRMAQLLVRMENHDSAVVAFQQALQRAPNNNAMALEVLEYFSRVKAWKAAKPVADQLKDVQTDNPVVKFLIARAYTNNGDKDAAKLATDAGKALLVNAPNKAQIEQAFADVLGTETKKK